LNPRESAKLQIDVCKTAGQKNRKPTGVGTPGSRNRDSVWPTAKGVRGRCWGKGLVCNQHQKLAHSQSRLEMLGGGVNPKRIGKKSRCSSIGTKCSIHRRVKQKSCKSPKIGNGSRESPGIGGKKSKETTDPQINNISG